MCKIKIRSVVTHVQQPRSCRTSHVNEVRGVIFAVKYRGNGRAGFFFFFYTPLTNCFERYFRAMGLLLLPKILCVTQQSPKTFHTLYMGEMCKMILDIHPKCMGLWRDGGSRYTNLLLCCSIRTGLILGECRKAKCLCTYA